jgi:hypothetical protein
MHVPSVSRETYSLYLIRTSHKSMLAKCFKATSNISVMSFHTPETAQYGFSCSSVPSQTDTFELIVADFDCLLAGLCCCSRDNSHSMKCVVTVLTFLAQLADERLMQPIHQARDWWRPQMGDICSLYIQSLIRLFKSVFPSSTESAVYINLHMGDTSMKWVPK